MSPNSKEITENNLTELFFNSEYKKIRTILIKNIKFKIPLAPQFKKSFYAVINPTDNCPISCPNCIYSSSNTNSLRSPELSIFDCKKIVNIFSEAGVKMVVFSGGGEPFENLKAILFIIENLSTLRDVIIITNGYFAANNAKTKNLLDKIYSAATNKRRERGFKSAKILFRLSLDKDHCLHIPPENVKNIINYFKKNKKNKYFKLIIRTILNDAYYIKNLFENNLGLSLLPKGAENSNKFPIIDGMPCGWFIDKDNFEIPTIFKPKYYTGRTIKRKQSALAMNSYEEIIKAELKSGSKFNLCLRGQKGEGHNYYENIIRGYNFWKTKIKTRIYNSKKKDTNKALALYITADSRLIINNGVPDMYVPIKDINNWLSFINFIKQDPIQLFLLENGPMAIKSVMRDIITTLDKQINKANFVFSINLLSLNSPLARLFATIYLTHKYYLENKITINSEAVLLFIKKFNKKIIFKDLIRNAEKDVQTDPIIGNTESLFANLNK